MHSETSPQAVCKFAIACADITPPVGMYHRMWGAATHDRSEGIHRPLRATVALFAPLTTNRSAPNASAGNDTSSGAAASGKPQILVGLDHCLLGAEEMRSLTERVTKATGTSSEQLTFLFSHTHAAGLMSLDRAELPGGDLIAGYLERVGVVVSELISQVLRDAQPATLVAGNGTCSLARHRDFWDAERGEFVCGYNPGGIADSTVIVIRAVAISGKTLGTFVNYACHPTTLAWDNRLVSPDYPGAMREVIEQASEAPCFFIHGASGDLGPREGFVGDTAVADRNGRQLGYAALAVMEGLDPPLTQYTYQGAVVSGATIGVWKHRLLDESQQHSLRRFSVQQTVLPLDYRPGLPTLAEVDADRKRWQQGEADALQRGETIKARDCRAQVERQTRMRSRLAQLPSGPKYPFTITTWKLGDLLWCFVPGEHYQILQQTLRAKTGRSVIVGTIANGWGPSYLPTADTYGKGIYQESIALLAAGSLERVIECALQTLSGLENA
ncbi:MAG: hypothetical protein RIS70_4216 [Planctomycetota bacterium]